MLSPPAYLRPEYYKNSFSDRELVLQGNLDLPMPQYQIIWTLFRSLMQVPIFDPKMNDDRREMHEYNYPEGFSVTGFRFKPGAELNPTGRHFHREKTEVFLVLSGYIRKLLCMSERDRQSREYGWLPGGSVIVIPRNLAHTFYCEPDTEMLCFSTRIFDPENQDIVPFLGLI